MAIASKIGKLAKQVLSQNPSIYQAIRCLSSSKIFVGGLPYSTDDPSLKTIFSEFGEVVEARVIMDRESGRSRGFGFVTFTSSEDASTAISGMDGKDIHGRIVRVNYASGPSYRYRPSAYGGHNYGGGGSFGGGSSYDGGIGRYDGSRTDQGHGSSSGYGPNKMGGQSGSYAGHNTGYGHSPGANYGIPDGGSGDDWLKTTGKDEIGSFDDAAQNYVAGNQCNLKQAGTTGDLFDGGNKIDYEPEALLGGGAKLDNDPDDYAGKKSWN